jgi:hypothetical protein
MAGLADDVRAPLVAVDRQPATLAAVIHGQIDKPAVREGMRAGHQCRCGNYDSQRFHLFPFVVAIQGETKPQSKRVKGDNFRGARVESAPLLKEP